MYTKEVDYMLIAHPTNDSKIKVDQLLVDHLTQTRILAENYGRPFDLAHVCGLAGLLHDVGKISHQFQDYIRDPSKFVNGGDHSTAGARILKNRLAYLHENQLLCEIVGNAIISHHHTAGLNDYQDLDGAFPYRTRVFEKELPEFDYIQQTFFDEIMSESELDTYITQANVELLSMVRILSSQRDAFNINLLFLSKFVYSCLIDADRTNTMEYETGQKFQDVNNTLIFRHQFEVLCHNLKKFQNDTEINKLRSSLSEICDKKALNKNGIHTLSIPTGGGKTLASLRYALRHALTFKQQRIIYIVPYNTVIEQNAAVVKRILSDDEHVLEFHSNVTNQNDKLYEEASLVDTLNLNEDSWTTPIIFTTMVQFLNNVYATGTKNARRLHNMSNSILIFDEIQSIPPKCLNLFNSFISYLTTFQNCDVLLCTATQPALNQLKTNIKADELVDDLAQIESSFSRVKIQNDIQVGLPPKLENELSDYVIGKISKHTSLLVILNTKKAVKKTYQNLLDYATDHDIHLFHLSTSMCAQHRKNVLNQIFRSLNAHEKTLCISTSLIEAGVDISFESVIRSLTGLDSIAQSAGRCNRNGELKFRKGIVYLIRVDPAFEDVSRLPYLKERQQITRKLLFTVKSSDLLTQSTLNKYFSNYYQLLDQQDETKYPVKQLGVSLYDLARRPSSNAEQFMGTASTTIARWFHVIDNDTYTVVVPYVDSKQSGKRHLAEKLIADLNDPHVPITRQLFKQLQPYLIQLYKNDVRQLFDRDGIFQIGDSSLLVLKPEYYSQEYGLTTDSTGRHQSLIV